MNLRCISSYSRIRSTACSSRGWPSVSVCPLGARHRPGSIGKDDRPLRDPHKARPALPVVGLLFQSTSDAGLHEGPGQRQWRFAFPLRGLSDPGWSVATPLGTRACGRRCVHCVDAFASFVHRRTGRDGTSLCRLSLSPPSWRFVLVHCAYSALLNAASTSKPRSTPNPKTTHNP